MSHNFSCLNTKLYFPLVLILKLVFLIDGRKYISKQWFRDPGYSVYLLQWMKIEVNTQWQTKESNGGKCNGHF